MKSIIILSFLALTLCKGFGAMGSWQKDTFAANDIRIDRARQAAEAKYFQITNEKEEDIELIPLAVYHQLVNGLNYKIIFAARNYNDNSLEFYDYDVYTGPFGSEANNFEYEVLSTAKLPIENNLSINSSKFGKINDACAQYIKDTRGERIAFVRTLRTNQNVIYNFGIYVVKIQTMAKRLGETVIVLEQEDGTFEVAYSLRDF